MKNIFLRVQQYSLSQKLPKIIAMAMALSVLGVIDSLLTSIVADSMTKERHDSNQELIGQGVGNMAAALIGGLPGAGATMRTVVNIKAGGTTRLSGMIHIPKAVQLALAYLQEKTPSRRRGEQPATP